MLPRIVMDKSRPELSSCIRLTSVIRWIDVLGQQRETSRLESPCGGGGDSKRF